MVKRIIAFFSAVVISISLYLVPVSAAWQNTLGYYYVNSGFAQWLVGGALSYGGSVLGAGAGTVVLPGGGTIEGSVLGSTVGTALAAGIYTLADYYAAGYTDEDFYRSERGFVDGLDRTEASSLPVVSGLICTSLKSYAWSSNFKYVRGYEFYKNTPDSFYSCIKSLGVNDKVLITAVTTKYLIGTYFDSTGMLCFGWFTNPYGIAHSSYLGVYNLSDLSFLQNISSSDSNIYYSKSYAEKSTNYLTRTVYAMTWSGFSGGAYRVYSKLNTDSVWQATTTTQDFPSFYDCSFPNNFYTAAPDSIIWDVNHTVAQPSGTDSSSRPTSIMDVITKWNKDNPVITNSLTINYYIAPTGTDDFYDPSLYDEEELVYTDPVTGMEYLTNGWTYDYLSRCYTLDMADDTFTIGSTVIDTIKLTYGDELLTVDHYSGGSLIRSDEYNYVMASGSECALNGHTNVITDTQDPTCTAAGHRTYTCSVCGNQTVEDIPKTDHAYGNIEVLQDPTCTVPGITTFTCSTCQGQYKDTVAALGHDWQPTSATEEAYVMPDNVSCPECHGDSFTYERQDLEVIPGKNLFDISRVTDHSKGYVINNGDGTLTVTTTSDSSSVSAGGLITLRHYAPGLRVGETYTLSFKTTGFRYIYLLGFGDVLVSGLSFVATDAILDSQVYWYASGNSTSAVLSNIQIEKGTTATEYEPYDPEYREIIPPLYTFTCSDPDCGAVWTKEAVYQGATVTYTCTRCDATRTEAVGEGLFDSIGNLIADGITWVTDKLAELINSLTGMMANFNQYLATVKDSGGQFPAFLAAVFALFPEDFMNVIWFGLIAVIILLVWKKWFS